MPSIKLHQPISNCPNQIELMAAKSAAQAKVNFWESKMVPGVDGEHGTPLPNYENAEEMYLFHLEDLRYINHSMDILGGDCG